MKRSLGVYAAGGLILCAVIGISEASLLHGWRGLWIAVGLTLGVGFFTFVYGLAIMMFLEPDYGTDSDEGVADPRAETRTNE